jgi:hypothetical protein
LNSTPISLSLVRADVLNPVSPKTPLSIAILYSCQTAGFLPALQKVTRDLHVACAHIQKITSRKLIRTLRSVSSGYLDSGLYAHFKNGLAFVSMTGKELPLLTRVQAY